MGIKFNKTKLLEVYEVDSLHIDDERGYIHKDYDKRFFFDNGIEFEPKENTMIYSKKNVLRGLHFQRVKEQSKLIRCISGNVWTVVVDLRENCTFGEWIKVDINEGRAIYIPGGCAVGTLALADSLIQCMYGEEFISEYSAGIKWNDKDLDISWPILKENIIVSNKDSKLMYFSEYKRGLFKGNE